MHRLLKILPILALTVAGVSSAKTIAYQVKVIDDVPSSTNYNWAISGSITTSCYGNTCATNWSDPSSGTSQANGATLKLLLPDNRIAVVECDMKENVGGSIALAIAAGMNNQSATPIYRDCRVPETGSTVTAEFKKNRVKLHMQDPSIDGSGRHHSETYVLIGILEPTAPSNTVASIAKGK